MHPYRTHTCGELRLDHDGTGVRLSGWVHRKRDHGNLLFVDLRDHYGLTQCVIDVSSPLFAIAEKVRPESVVTVTGKVVKRSDDTINPNLPTGEVESLGRPNSTSNRRPRQLPMQVYGDEPNIPTTSACATASSTCAAIVMHAEHHPAQPRSSRQHPAADDRSGLHVEFQTPILTASSPEGARDFLVPSRASIPASSTRCPRRLSNSSS